MAAHPARFRDPRSTAYDFLGSVVVRCPRCAQAARIVPAPGVDSGPGGRRTIGRRLICRGCGLARERRGHPVMLAGGSAGPATDPWFGVPLRFRAETRHGWLWAYDRAHLDLIRRYVAAPLRERAPWYDTGRKMTLVARLPAWIKHAKNRDEVLRAIRRAASA
ncbi:hypothetical protein [Streptomyces sp. NPDC056049]|uniref:hypothetical protein n=1 Tax=Streptomyces sp. NPDC056049 TaxID=3345693 RepID=UPI0035DBC7E7